MMYAPRLKKMLAVPELDVEEWDLEHYEQSYKDAVARAVKLRRSARRPIAPRLVDVGFDGTLVPIIPPEIRPQIKHLELFTYDKRNAADIPLFYNLESLTVHQSEGYYSDTSRGVLLYNSRPKPDAPVTDFPGDVLPPVESLAAVKQGGRTYLPCPDITSFKWIYQHHILGPKLCKKIEKFILCRPKLRRLDLKVIPPNKESARAILDAMKALPNLEVLGFEFKGGQFAYYAGIELIAHIPKTVKYLRYNARGWDLRFTPNSVDTVVQHAVSTFSSELDLLTHQLHLARLPPSSEVFAHLRQHRAHPRDTVYQPVQTVPPLGLEEPHIPGDRSRMVRPRSRFERAAHCVSMAPATGVQLFDVGRPKNR